MEKESIRRAQVDFVSSQQALLHATVATTRKQAQRKQRIKDENALVFETNKQRRDELEDAHERSIEENQRMLQMKEEMAAKR